MVPQETGVGTGAGLLGLISRRPRRNVGPNGYDMIEANGILHQSQNNDHQAVSYNWLSLDSPHVGIHVFGAHRNRPAHGSNETGTSNLAFQTFGSLSATERETCGFDSHC